MSWSSFIWPIRICYDFMDPNTRKGVSLSLPIVLLICTCWTIVRNIQNSCIANEMGTEISSLPRKLVPQHKKFMKWFQVQKKITSGAHFNALLSIWFFLTSTKIIRFTTAISTYDKHSNHKPQLDRNFTWRSIYQGWWWRFSVWYILCPFFVRA